MNKIACSSLLESRRSVFSCVFFMIFFISNTELFGQSVMINGKVISNQQQTPLPFATVSIKGKPIGVVSNEVGEFSINFQMTDESDTLVAASLGYENYYLPVKDLKTDESLVIILQEKPFVLGEVVISDEQVPAIEIIKKAIVNIRLNYPQQPYLMEGFYRDFKRENNKYIGLFEAAVSIHDRGYRRSRYGIERENVYLNEVRKVKTLDYKSDLFDDHNILERLLAQNEPRYLSNGLDWRNLQYNLEGYIYLDDRLVYVIRTNKPWESKLYIDTENYAILKVELDARWDGAKKNEWSLNDSTMNRVKFVKKTLQFKQYGKYYYPEYMSYAGNLEGIDKRTGEVVFTSFFQQELLINQVKVSDFTLPDRKKLMSMQRGLDFHKKPYNETFWTQYNIIKDSPLDREIINDLEKSGQLDSLFDQQ